MTQTRQTARGAREMALFFCVICVRLRNLRWLLCTEMASDIDRGLRNYKSILAEPHHASEFSMQMAMIGLGRMGGNMVERLMRKGHQAIVFDRSGDVVAKYQRLGATPARDLSDVVAKLQGPRIVWIIVPAGAP